MILYSGSGPRADQGFLTLTDFGQADERAWPAQPPVPHFWDYCAQTKSLCGIHIGYPCAEIWLWRDLDHDPVHLLTGPERQAWYYPTLSPDRKWLAVITTRDQFYPLRYQHPGQLLIFYRHNETWQLLGQPASCQVESMAWQGENLFFQDRHGRLVCASVTVDGILETGRFVYKRAHSPRLSPDQQKIAARYGNHLYVGDIDIALKGQICDHGWAPDGRLWAVLDDGFYHCQMIWLMLREEQPMRPEPADFSVPQLDRLVVL